MNKRKKSIISIYNKKLNSLEQCEAQKIDCDFFDSKGRKGLKVDRFIYNSF